MPKGETDMSMGLLIVDVQNDFLPGGSLAVTDGDKIIPVINRAMKHFHNDHIVLTRDAHPHSHKSFASNHEGRNVFDTVEVNGIQQVLWPDHCVVGTPGNKISGDLEVPDKEAAQVIDKGRDPEYDSYSGFKDAGGEETDLEAILKELGVDLLYVVGLATDYCVKATVNDALGCGFKVRVIVEGIKGVAPETTEQALAEMDAAGAEFVKIDAIGVPVKPLD